MTDSGNGSARHGTAAADIFNAIESIPIGLAVLEYLGVVLVVGWLWVVRGQRPGGSRWLAW